MTYQEKITELYYENPELAEKVLGFIANTPFIENRRVEELLSALRKASDLHKSRTK